MIAYLVYDAEYRLYEVHEEKPVFRYGVGWWSDGYRDGVSSYDIPEETKSVLAEKGILKVITTPRVLFHVKEDVFSEHKEEEGDEYIQHIDKEEEEG